MSAAADRTIPIEHHHRRASDRGPPPRWSFDRRISLSHVLAALSLLGAALVVGNAFDRRVTRLEDRQLATQTQLLEISKKLDDLDSDLHHDLENRK